MFSKSKILNLMQKINVIFLVKLENFFEIVFYEFNYVIFIYF